jgi:hypothetical protein
MHENLDRGLFCIPISTYVPRKATLGLSPIKSDLINLSDFGSMDYTESFFLPELLRREMMALPPFVLILTRKPWVVPRFFLFG